MTLRPRGFAFSSFLAGNFCQLFSVFVYLFAVLSFYLTLIFVSVCCKHVVYEMVHLSIVSVIFR